MTETIEKPPLFPANYRDMVVVNNDAAEKAMAFGTQINELEQQQRMAEGITEITHALLTSWQDDDRGKYSLSVSFLDRAGRQRVVAEEYLQANMRRFTEEEWRNASYAERRQGISPYIRIVPLAEVATRECPLCKHEHPVLEWYRQTEDGPYGDTWLKRFLLLCPDPTGIPRLAELDRRESDSRF